MVAASRTHGCSLRQLCCSLSHLPLQPASMVVACDSYGCRSPTSSWSSCSGCLRSPRPAAAAPSPSPSPSPSRRSHGLSEGRAPRCHRRVPPLGRSSHNAKPCKRKRGVGAPEAATAGRQLWTTPPLRRTRRISARPGARPARATRWKRSWRPVPVGRGRSGTGTLDRREYGSCAYRFL